MELPAGALANLGVGMANGVSHVVHEEGLIDEVTFTIEQGIYGGVPGVGLDSGTAVDPTALIDMSAQFDLYNGGALDFAGLAFAQIDQHGNVNVTKAGDTVIGPGGFTDISQKARTVVFCGSFTGGGLRTQVRDGNLDIISEGRYAKFVRDVDAVSFSAARALREGQRVVYVTERAVFELREQGLTLTETAPGVDIERDILGLLPFRPHMGRRIEEMNPSIFRPQPMGMILRPAEARRRTTRDRRKALK
jgi:propionate CoA-transferase